MKKLFYTLLAAAATLCAVGCAKESRQTVDALEGNTVEASFDLGFSGTLTKAVSDGLTATRLVVGVYDKELGYVESLSVAPDAADYKTAFANLAATYKTRLVKGHGYDIVFLAVAPEGGAYAIDLAAGKLTVNTEGLSNDENRDAFYAVASIDKVTGSVSQSVTLKRPFAQFNVISSKKDYEDAVAALVHFKASALKVTAPTVLHLVDGSVDTPAEYNLAAAPMADLAVNFEPYKTAGDYWLMADYILVGESDMLDVTFTLFSEEREDALNEISVPSVPFKRNYRTTAYGSVLTTEGEFNLIIDPIYEGEEVVSVDENRPEITMYDTTLPAPGSKINVKVGDQINFKAIHPIETVLPTYASSNEAVGTITEAGLFTAKADGTTTVSIAFPAVSNGEVVTKADGEEAAADAPANYAAVTLTYTVVVGDEQPGPGPGPEPGNGEITIDGSLSDWDNVAAITGVNAERIPEWKVTADANNIYLLFKVAKEKIAFSASGSYNWESYIAIGFDTDNKATTGKDGGMGLGEGKEAIALVYPWRGDVEGSPECLKGEDTQGKIECPVGTATDAHVTTAGKFDGNFCYVEISIPLAKIGSPSGEITVNHTMNWSATGESKVTLSGGTTPPADQPVTATITASDVTVEEGKTASIGATTNSTATITYTVADASVATVSAAGVVTGVKAGSTTIKLAVAAVEGKFTAAEKTINVTVTAAATPPPAGGISLDGAIGDWAGITAYASSATSRIREWSYAADANNVYFLFKMRKNRCDGGRPLAIGFDIDDTGTLSDNNNMKNCEIMVRFYPFTNSGEATQPVCVNGYVTNATINGTEDASAVKAYMYDDGSDLGSSDSNIYLEVGVPKSKLTGLPAAGTSVQIGASYDYYFAGFQSITLK